MFPGWGHYTKSFFALFVSRQCSKLTFCAKKRSSFAKMLSGMRATWILRGGSESVDNAGGR